jgi:hypothetical protein
MSLSAEGSVGFFIDTYSAGTTHLSCAKLVKEKQNKQTIPMIDKILSVFILKY